MHAYPRAQKRAFVRLAALGVAALTALGLSLGSAAPALAHDELVGTAGELSADGTRVDLTLSFSNEIMDVGTEIVATGPDGEDLIDGTPVVEGRDVTQGITMPGFDRTVTVVWRVVSSDGHPIGDELAFAVLERDGGTELQFRNASDDAQDEHGEHEHEHEGGHEDGDTGHEHGDEHEMTTQSAEDDATAGQPWWLWALIGVGAAGVIAAVATSAVVGAKRRRQAMDGGTAEGKDAETDR